MYGAIFLFAIGTLLILLSSKKWYLQLTSMVPMLFSIGVILNVLTYEKYIIPEDFNGVVYVITDKENGQDKEYDFYERVYRIPASGVLFTKFNQKAGINNRTFYQINKRGELKKLGVLDYRHYIAEWIVNPPKTEPSRDSFAVFTPELQYDFDSERYNMVFTVGRYKDIKSWNYSPKEVIDSLRKGY